LASYAALNGLSYTMEELLRTMDEEGIDRGLLLSPPLRSGAPLPNERVLELCDESSGRLSPVFTVEPRAAEVESALSLARQNLHLLKGFKIRLGYLNVFPYDRIYDTLYAFAEAEGLPVMFHTGDTATATGSLEHSHPLGLDKLANARPGLKIVICHFGNPWILDVGELIYKHPNVFADVSGLIVGGSKYMEGYVNSIAEQLTRAIYYAGGAEKVLFGTDYPVSTPSLAIELVRRLRIDEADREAILGGNAAKVFRI